jgi:hypothetical protein
MVADMFSLGWGIGGVAETIVRKGEELLGDFTSRFFLADSVPRHVALAA